MAVAGLRHCLAVMLERLKVSESKLNLDMTVVVIVGKALERN